MGGIVYGGTKCDKISLNDITLWTGEPCNMNVYSPVEHVLTELAAHGIKNRTCAVIENGSWAPQSGKIMRELLGKLPGTTVLEDGVTIKSAPDKDTYDSVIKLADALAATFA